MKINMPVTNIEILFDDSQFMLTKTDMKGVITFANADFIKISGFTESELVGSSHNIVRHPDMPIEAFADMWRSLKAGKPWTGLVKNRTKNGDFYWVLANASPILENNQVTGYLSVRRKPSRQQVDAAASAYRLFKEGNAKGLTIIDGKVVKDSFLSNVKNRINNIKVSQRLLSMVAIAVAVVAIQAGIGLYELSKSNNSIKSVYEDRMIPVQQLNVIDKDVRASMREIDFVFSQAKVVNNGKINAMVIDSDIATKSAGVIEKHLKSIDEKWKAYMATYLTPEETKLAQKFAKSRDELIKTGIEPTVAAMKNHDYNSMRAADDNSESIYATVSTDSDDLIKLQLDIAEELDKDAMRRFENTRLLTFAGFAMAISLLVWLGLIISRSITKPLQKSMETFAEISQGNLTSSIDTSGSNELSKVLQSLKGMQTLLSVNENTLKESAIQTQEQSALYEGQLAAIAKSTGVIEFSMDGKVIAANDIFLNVLGYSREEAIGQHHSAFVDPSYRTSAEYRTFWEKLNLGEAVTGEFKRINKDGKEIWLQASYNPILCAAGKPYKVVKYATDITQAKLIAADNAGQLAAIGKIQGVIEFDLTGKITEVNDNFAAVTGYNKNEIIGNHHSMFVEPSYKSSQEYKSFWDKLARGEADEGQYKRIGKGGKEVWLQASYNPIMDMNGKPFKVVKYATDITNAKLAAADNAGQLAAIGKIQGVIEFDLTGNITKVNDNFANVTGYSASEIVGNHHSMFVEPSYKSSQEYKSFWDKLGSGIADAGQYKRIGKGGKEVWLQASYNPIMDMNGKPFKVVKFATDITEQYNSAATLANAVEETQAIIEEAKSGDLSSRVPLEGKSGAIASLCDGVNALMDKMTEVIVQVREAGETINTAANEISTGNNDLSSRTEQQASSLEETAASMEELASTVKNNAENAKQANQLAAAASGVAIKGGEVVGQVVTTMSAINESAKKIEDIISVIDGIAFQTNILALNAAVEAARAGEQGRGFAVVAGEVRNLAQRSASAAKEIKELITDSVTKTAEGTVQVEQAGKTMEEIVSSVQRVTDIMGEISAASVEQSSGINQVNQAVTSMDEVTQQNAALVEEAAAAAESLVEQATSLVDVVSEFKLNNGSSSHKDRRHAHSPMRDSNVTGIRSSSKSGTYDR